jgi:hypothetical protein
LILLLIAIKAVRKVVTSNHDDGTKWHHPIVFVWRKKIIIILLLLFLFGIYIGLTMLNKMAGLIF